MNEMIHEWKNHRYEPLNGKLRQLCCVTKASQQTSSRSILSSLTTGRVGDLPSSLPTNPVSKHSPVPTPSTVLGPNIEQGRTSESSSQKSCCIKPAFPFQRTSFLVTRSSTGMLGCPIGKTVSPPSFSPRSDMYNRIVAKRFPPVPAES